MHIKQITSFCIVHQDKKRKGSDEIMKLSEAFEGRKIFSVKDYGAIGDGIHDDGIAIRNACEAVRVYKDGPSVLLFEENKCYFVKKLFSDRENDGSWYGGTAVFLDHANDVIIEGNGSRIECGTLVIGSWFVFSENVIMRNITFDYRIKPFQKGAVTEYDAATKSFVVTMHHSLQLPEKEFVPPQGLPYFALPDEFCIYRHFLWIDKICEIDSTHYRIYPSNYEEALHFIDMHGRDLPWIWPAGPAGHLGSPVHGITSCKNVEINNVVTEAAPAFTYYWRSNSGYMKMIGVKLQPSANSDIEYMVSWRDVLHIKDNHGPLIMENCDIGWAGDDFINVSCTSLYVTRYSPCSISLRTTEHKAFPDLKPGYTIEGYDTHTGKYYGEAKIVSISSDKDEILLDKDLKLPENFENIIFDCPELASPKTIIKNCKFVGTGRFKGECDIIDSYFKLCVMWLMTEVPCEGPIPKKVRFKNCIFDTGNVETASFNRAVKGSDFREIADQIDITLENCQFINGSVLDEMNGTKVKIL